MKELKDWFQAQRKRMPKFYEYLKEQLGDKTPSLNTVRRVIYENRPDNFNILPAAVEFIEAEIMEQKALEEKMKSLSKYNKP